MLLTPRVETTSNRVDSLTSTTNPALRLALTRAPGLAEFTRQIEDLTLHAKTLDPLPGPEAVTADLGRLLADDEDLPGDLVQRYRDAAAAAYGWNTAVDQLGALLSTLHTTQRQILVEHQAGVFRSLHDQLLDTLAELTAATTALDGASTADEAIAEGKTEHWTRRSTSRATYRDIRAAQELLLAKLIPEGNTEVREWGPLVLHASDLAAVWPALPQWKRYGYTVDEDGDVSRRAAPWPDPNGDDFDLWLVRHPEAKPWVPSINDATALIVSLENRTLPPRATRELSEDQLKPAEMAAEIWRSRKRNPLEVHDLTL